MSPKIWRGVACPRCGSRETTVSRTHGTATGDRMHRRRECVACHAHWNTVELQIGIVVGFGAGAGAPLRGPQS